MEHKNIISQWPSLADFASDLGILENTAKQMRTRNSIHGRYWDMLIAAAKRRKIKGVSVETLSEGARIVSRQGAEV